MSGDYDRWRRTSHSSSLRPALALTFFFCRFSRVARFLVDYRILTYIPHHEMKQLDTVFLDGALDAEKQFQGDFHCFLSIESYKMIACRLTHDTFSIRSSNMSDYFASLLNSMKNKEQLTLEMLKNWKKKLDTQST